MTSQSILPATPGQTVGPFYGYALPYDGGEELVQPGHPDAIRLHGTVYDGAGQPVPDALLEIWQADAQGHVVQAEGSLHRDGWTFTGFGRAAVDPAGRYSFTTVRPGPTEDGAARFIAMTVFARGLLNRLFTRIYLPGDEVALDADPLLRSVPAERRSTLVARADSQGYAFDVRLQGDDETVFLAFPGGLMADLFWPGDERAGELFQPEMLLGFLVRVEEAWLDALVRSGPAPAEAAVPLHRLVGRRDVDQLAADAEASGNPVVPLVGLLRQRLEHTHPDAARWLHRGLTSQDVLDTALVMCARTVVAQVRAQIDLQVSALAHLAERHRDDVMAGRTLTQHAVPITFGLKAAQWLQGVLDARDELEALHFPLQVGGAAGTLAAVVDLAGDVDAAQFLVAETAGTLDLDPALPWHTSRSPFTRYADALVRATDAWGHIANDVLLLARPEIGELAEPKAEGRGGSSTMPHKANPVLSVLVRRAALTTPHLAAQLHLAAATTVDERPDGSWHTEWSTLATLSRHAVTAGSQVAELLEGLHVDTGRMAAVVKQQASALLAEQRSLAGLSGVREADFEPRHYLGTYARTIDAVLRRARHDETSQEDL